MVRRSAKRSVIVFVLERTARGEALHDGATSSREVCCSRPREVPFRDGQDGGSVGPERPASAMEGGRVLETLLVGRKSAHPAAEDVLGGDQR